MGMSAENLIFSKVFPDGTSAKALVERIDLKAEPFAEEEEKFNRENERKGATITRYTGPADVCTIFYKNKEIIQQIERLIIRNINEEPYMRHCSRIRVRHPPP